MDSDSWSLFVLLIALILGGGYFAASETAFASVNPMRIKHRAENGERRAQRAQYVLDHFNKALSTLLIGNNVMHIGTAALATYLVTKLWGEGYTAYSTLVTTVVVFLVSEMVPKQFAKDRPEATALFFAPSLYLLMWLLTPVSAIFDGLAAFVTRFLKVKQEPVITEDELIEMIDSLAETEEDGQQRSELLHSALKFDDAIVYDVMTPLDAVEGIRSNMKPEEVLPIIRSTRYTRLPVYQTTPENIVGVLDVRNYIKAHLYEGEKLSIRKLMRKPMLVEDSRRIDDLFNEMTQSRTHMCVARNNRGQVTGIVTMEDILEQLVGEIYDEEDEIPAAQEAREGAV